MNNPKNYHFTLPQGQRPEFVPLKSELHPEEKWLSSYRARSRKTDVINTIDTIVIHATAGFATQHAIDAWKLRKASTHWIIPDENEPQHGHFVWSTVNEAKAAYHVKNLDQHQQILGSGPNTNNRSLGIEIVNTQNVEQFVDPFSTWQIQMAARIVLYAWARYPLLKHVISHAKLDPSRRSDPGVNFPWKEFKEMVLSHSALEHRNQLVFESYDLSEPVEFEGNCCLP